MEHSLYEKLMLFCRYEVLATYNDQNEQLCCKQHRSLNRYSVILIPSNTRIPKLLLLVVDRCTSDLNFDTKFGPGTKYQAGLVSCLEPRRHYYDYRTSLSGHDAVPCKI